MPTPAKPSFIYAVRLKCLYCGRTPLQKKGSWFDFGDGCSTCNYRYEREEGYFAGSTWMVNYAVISAVGISVAAWCALYSGLSGLGIASVASIALVIFGIVWFPFGSALWMYCDHLVHPLKDSDALKK